MKFVLYTSTLNQDDHDVFVVPDIIRTSRTQNRVNQITGILLFDGINFTQYFEGTDAAVNQLLDKIMHDDRHKNVVVLLTGHHQTRLYAEWKMGYVDISEHAHAPENPILQTGTGINIESFKKLVDGLLVE